jgi:dTDP-4-amino-4,6-dideoxy-D-galactose acyltransferase
LIYELLPWDSEFFGFPIGQISGEGSSDALAPTLAQADADGIRCLYYLIAADHLAALHTALRHGFMPYDIRVELERRPVAPAPPEAGGEVREADLADEPLLSRLIAETITATRFALDDHFPQDLVRLLYAEWVRRGLSSGSTRRVLLAEPDAGFLVCGFDTEALIGSIELVGVTRRMARRGIGRILMDNAHAAMLESGCERARVVTQGHNVSAQRLYQSLGYKTVAVAWWLHRWHPD